MNPTDHLLSLIEQGHDLMARERSFLLRGEFDGLARLSADKHGLLVSLEAAMARVRGTGPVRTAIAALIDDSHRNERIILAARQVSPPRAGASMPSSPPAGVLSPTTATARRSPAGTTPHKKSAAPEVLT